MRCGARASLCSAQAHNIHSSIAPDERIAVPAPALSVDELVAFLERDVHVSIDRREGAWFAISCQLSAFLAYYYY